MRLSVYLVVSVLLLTASSSFASKGNVAGMVCEVDNHLSAAPIYMNIDIEVRVKNARLDIHGSQEIDGGVRIDTTTTSIQQILDENLAEMQGVSLTDETDGTTLSFTRVGRDYDGKANISAKLKVGNRIEKLGRCRLKYKHEGSFNPF